MDGYLSLLLPLLEKTRSVSGPPPGLEGEVGEVGDRGDRDPPPQDDKRAGGRPGDRPTTQGGFMGVCTQGYSYCTCSSTIGIEKKIKYNYISAVVHHVLLPLL